MVADLTGLNANVFYELGVRHVLRGTGTIMILDERETSIPFDVTTYRVIKFRSDMEGIGILSTELKVFVSQFEAGTVNSRDNLVHDLLPGLPVNALATAEGSQEGALRGEIQSLRKQLQAYAKRFGELEESDLKEDPTSVLHQALLEAEEGNLPSLLVDRAEKFADAGEHKEFLETIVRIIELKTSRPSPKAFMRLMAAAQGLDLTTVLEALLDKAHSLYPTNREVRLIRLSTFAHSEDPRRRQTAREELTKYLGLTIGKDTVKLGRTLSRTDFRTFGVMLDAYHRDNLHDDAFRLAAKLTEEYSGKAVLLRNLGRAYEKIGNDTEALRYFVEAAIAPDADDTAGVWLGNELHNRERHVDAAEAYTLACVRDPNDGGNFAHLAEEVSWAIMEGESGTQLARRQLPARLRNAEEVAAVVTAAIGCGQMPGDTVERLRSACKRVGLDFEEIVVNVQQSGDPSLVSRRARIDLAQRAREDLKSKLTAPGVGE